jgi:hypothetical protein
MGRQEQYGDFIHILSTFFQYCFCRPDFLSVLAGSAFLYPLSEDMDDFSIEHRTRGCTKESVLSTWGSNVEAMIDDHGGLHTQGPGRDGPRKTSPPHQLHHTSRPDRSPAPMPDVVFAKA